MTLHTHSRLLAFAILTLGLVTFAGCKNTTAAPPDDNALAANVQKALAADTTIASQPVQATAVGGVVTLTGTVSDNTARNVAASDAAHVAGVKEVVNNLTVQGVVAAQQPPPTITTPAPTPTAPVETRVATREERERMARHDYPGQPPQQVQGPPPVQVVQQAPPPPAPVVHAPPPPPPAPVYRDLNVPAGTSIAVRITQTLDSGTTQEGTSFSGVTAAPVIINGEVAVPAGASVSGRVTTVHDAGHFSGNSLLTVTLTSIRRHGDSISVDAEPYSVEGKGRGKNTAEKVGGGAAVGAILGGILGGGKGAAIGAAAGGGAGAGVNAVTRGQQVQIPSESVVRFHLASGFTVRSMGPAGEERDHDGGLQQHP